MLIVGDSACGTSIARTYYTWKIIRSPDISYNIFRMGLWTAAEMTTGILVSCLPVLPRFFQRYDLHIISTLSYGSKAIKSLGRHNESGAATHATFADASAASKTVVGDHDSQLDGMGKYLSLDGFELSSMGRNSLIDRPDLSYQAHATKREDLETGIQIF